MTVALCSYMLPHVLFWVWNKDCADQVDVTRYYIASKIDDRRGKSRYCLEKKSPCVTPRDNLMK